MRDILKKATTAAMVAGAALLVSACGDEAETNNAVVTDLGNDTSMDLNATDMDMDMNAMDMNATDMNAMDMNATDMNATNTQ